MAELNEKEENVESVSIVETPTEEVLLPNEDNTKQEENQISEAAYRDKAHEDNNEAFAKYLRTERELLDRERAALVLAEGKLKAQQEEQIRSEHLVNISTFFWLHYLFNIPIIGFIAAIVFSFVGGNISRKNYARSRFIWHLIWIFVMLLIALAVILVFKFFGGAIKDILTDLFKDSIEDRL